jgi:hypothetical protein
MAKIRAVVVEMEGEDATVLDAIRSCLGTRNASVAELAPAPLGAVVPRPEGFRGLANGKGSPPPAKARKMPGRRATAKLAAELAGKGEPGTDGKGGCRAKVYALLKSRGPLTSAELIGVLPEYNPGSIYLALKELRGAMVVRTRAIDGEQRNELVR